METSLLIRDQRGKFIKGHPNIVPQSSTRAALRTHCPTEYKKRNSWAIHYDKCIICGSIESPHIARGHCRKCYTNICLKETKRLYKINNPSKYKKNCTSTGFKYSEATHPKKTHCEICNKECDTVLDHCHKNNKFRGWLCMSCNTSLGHVKDKIEILHRMIEYLLKNS